MKRSIDYPEWAEKYRGKGRTIRKVRDGYGLYECTSTYSPGQKYPKSRQTYLGMITEKDGFIPKKSEDQQTSHSSYYLEYGLSHFIMANFKRDLMRSSYNATEDLIIFGIIYFLFGDFDEVFIRFTYLTHGKKEELSDRVAKGIAVNRLKTVSNKIEKLLELKIPNDRDRNVLTRLLLLTVIGDKALPASVVYVPEISEITERYGLKL